MINLFPVYDEIDSAEVKRISRIKTISFIVAFVASIAIAGIYYSTTKIPITTVINNPEYDDYENLFQKNDIVTCDCQTVHMNIRDFTNVSVPADPFCQEVGSKYRDVCNGTYASICPGTPIFGFLGALVELCDTSLLVLERQMEGFQSQVLVTETLLDEIALYQRTDALADLGILISENLLDTAANMFGSFLDIDKPNLWSQADVEPKSIDTNFTEMFSGLNSIVWHDSQYGNCTCGHAWDCKIWIWLGDIGGVEGTRTCSVFQTIMDNKVKVWSSAQFFKQAIGFNVDDSSLPNLYTDDEDEGILLSNESLYYNQDFQTMFREGMSGELSIVIDHHEYFETCRPSKCEFIALEHRGVIEIIAVIAGLVGGFKVAIDFVVKGCCMRQEKKAITAFQITKRRSARVAVENPNDLEHT